MRCPKCRKEKDPAEFHGEDGQPTGTCATCLEESKVRYAASREDVQPISWETIQEIFHLSGEEAHVVNLAAHQTIIGRRWKKRNKGRWAGPTADKLVDAASDDIRRRCTLLLAVSKLSKRLLHEEGVSSKSFFNGPR